MRTTLDIDNDVFQVVKELASMHNTTTGKMLSELARKGLQPIGDADLRNGVPLLPPRKGEGVVTMNLVNQLRDEER